MSQNVGTVDIVELKKYQIKGVSEIFARAFFDYPTMVVSCPDDIKRRKGLPILFNSMVKYSWKYGDSFAVLDNEKIIGGFIALKPEHPKISELLMIFCGAVKIPFKLGFDFIKNQQKIEMTQKDLRKNCAPIPHVYCWSAAIDPSYQHKGYGRTLIKYLFERYDDLDLPCYLETAKNYNVNLYERMGFQIVEKRKIDENLETWAMLRYPNSINSR